MIIKFCDRCGRKTTSPKHLLVVRSLNEPEDGDITGELCANCVEDLLKWTNELYLERNRRRDKVLESVEKEE